MIFKMKYSTQLLIAKPYQLYSLYNLTKFLNVDLHHGNPERTAINEFLVLLRVHGCKAIYGLFLIIL